MKGASEYWPAEQALDQQVKGVSVDAMRRYFETVQARTPEVPPRLENRSPDAFLAWAKAARARDDIAWNRVLLDAAGEDATRLKRLWAWLHDANQAQATSEKSPALAAAARDTTLVKALQRHVRGTWRAQFSAGWVAILLIEGSAASARAASHFISRFTFDDLSAPDPMTDPGLDDLRRLAGAPKTAHAKAARKKLDAVLAKRDALIGQPAFFAAIGERLFAPEFSIAVEWPLKSGHRVGLTVSRDWRSSGIDWWLTIGKSTAQYACNENGAMTNALDLEKPALGELPTWLAAVIEKRLSTKPTAPPVVTGTGRRKGLDAKLATWLSSGH